MANSTAACCGEKELSYPKAICDKTLSNLADVVPHAVFGTGHTKTNSPLPIIIDEANIKTEEP